MFKKITTLFILLTVLSLSLAACSSTAVQSNTPVASAMENEQVAEETAVSSLPSSLKPVHQQAHQPTPWSKPGKVSATTAMAKISTVPPRAKPFTGRMPSSPARYSILPTTATELSPTTSPISSGSKHPTAARSVGKKRRTTAVCLL